MDFSAIVAMAYVFDILYYTVIDDNWGFGIMKWENSY
jgi:hypothetical protein